MRIYPASSSQPLFSAELQLQASVAYLAYAVGSRGSSFTVLLQQLSIP